MPSPVTRRPSGNGRTTLSRTAPSFVPTAPVASTQSAAPAASTVPTPTVPASSPASGVASRPSRHRADLQGLRAIASILVAVYHTWLGTVSGGVDIFFVVTGMLITTTLLGNVERTGRVRLPSFLLRLAGRLFPLAGIVLAVITILVLTVWPPFQWEATLRQLFASATYWENWLLASSATDYLAQGDAKSPVQHFWAMSVQGQFYLIWAAVFALVALLVARVPRFRARPTALVVVGAISVGSAAWAVNGVLTNAVFAYYDTFARLWEFGLGAVVALVVADRILPRPARIVLGVLGLGLVLTAGLLPAAWPYPGPVALWPALGATAILLSHQPGADLPGPVTRLLSWRPLAWLGGYSYGIYLWSWPSLVAYHTIFPTVEQVDLVGGVVVLLVAIGLAIGTIRGLRAFDAWRTAHLEPDSRRRHLSVFGALVPIVAITGLVVPMAVAGVTEAPASEQRRLAATPASSFDTEDEVRAAVRESVTATALPELKPGFGTESRAREWTVDGCASVDTENMAACRYADRPDASGEIFLIGDSQATSWLPGLRQAVDGRAAIQVMTREMCPLSTVPVASSWQGMDADAMCRDHNAWVLDQIAQRRPMLVVLSFGAWDTARIRLPAGESDPTAALVGGMRPYLAELQALGIRTVVLDSPPPTPGNWQNCALARTPEQYTETCLPGLPMVGEHRLDEIDRAAGDFGATYVPTLEWFCDRESGRCPSSVDDFAIRADGSHLTWRMSQALAPLIARSIGLDDLWAA